MELKHLLKEVEQALKHTAKEGAEFDWQHGSTENELYITWRMEDVK